MSRRSLTIGLVSSLLVIMLGCGGSNDNSSGSAAAEAISTPGSSHDAGNPTEPPGEDPDNDGDD